MELSDYQSGKTHENVKNRCKAKRKQKLTDGNEWRVRSRKKKET